MFSTNIWKHCQWQCIEAHPFMNQYSIIEGTELDKQLHECDKTRETHHLYYVNSSIVSRCLFKIYQKMLFVLVNF